MANKSNIDQRRFIEFNHLFVDYTEGDVMVFDHVRDLKKLTPVKPMSNRIVMCLSGDMHLEVSGKRFDVSATDLLYFPPTAHIDSNRPSPDFSCQVLCLSDHIIQGLLHDRIGIWRRTAYTNEMKVLPTTDVCREEFASYFALIHSKIQHSDRQAPYEILQSLIRALLLDINHLLEESLGAAQEQKLTQGKSLFNRFLTLISNSEVKRQPITHYASQLAITPKYLTMLCLKYSNKTASDWVIQYTIEDIRFYLRSSNLSIKEISAKLGFSNMSHFGSYVRKHMGSSPSEYRENKE
jgi:AraC-like DNA-binding protein